MLPTFTFAGTLVAVGFGVVFSFGVVVGFGFVISFSFGVSLAFVVSFSFVASLALVVVTFFCVASFGIGPSFGFEGFLTCLALVIAVAVVVASRSSSVLAPSTTGASGASFDPLLVCNHCVSALGMCVCHPLLNIRTHPLCPLSTFSCLYLLCFELQ